MNRWKDRPVFIDELSFNTSITHVAFLDENGDNNMKHIIKAVHKNKEIDQGARFFTLTSVLFKLDDLSVVRENCINLKNKHWPKDGCYKYKPNQKMKKVCFHSREIRNSLGPFSNSSIDYDNFIKDLSIFMKTLPSTIISSFIDKQKLYMKYLKNAKAPYELALTFILERIVQKLTSPDDQILIILESRGKKEDRNLHKHIMHLINNGTYYVPSFHFKKIKGVFFNQKRPIHNQELSYFGLEIADLCSHPIHRYCISNRKNKAFQTIEHQIHGVPSYFGKGIKKFP